MAAGQLGDMGAALVFKLWMAPNSDKGYVGY